MSEVEQTTDVLVCVHRKGDRLYLGSMKPQVGMPIYNSIDGQGKITKINKRSVLVELDSHIERFAVRSARPHIGAQGHIYIYKMLRNLVLSSITYKK